MSRRNSEAWSIFLGQRLFALSVNIWNNFFVNKNECNFIKVNVTFPETIKNMSLQKKKNNENEKN